MHIFTNYNSLNPTPPNVTNNIFPATIYSTATLYVSEGSIDAYKATNYWKNFYTIEEMNSGVEDAVVENAQAYSIADGGITFTADGKKVEVYNLGGQLQYSGTTQTGETVTLPTSGIYIITIDGKSHKVSVK